MELRNKVYLLIVASVVFASLQPVLLSFGRGAGINTFFLVTYACSIPAAFLFVALKKKTGELKAALLQWKTLLMLFVIGIVLFLPSEYGITYSENYVSASLAAVMLRTAPLLMLVLLPLILRERLSKYQIAALSLGFVGILIGVSGGNPLGIFQNSSAGIDLFLVLMAFVYSFSIILVRKYMYDISVIMFFAGIAMLAVVTAISAATGTGFQPISSLQLGIAVLMGVFYNVINYSVYYNAARQIKATVAANLLSMSPFLTFMFAGIILGQAVHAYYIVIAVLSVAGIAIQSFDRIGGQYISRSGSRSLKRMVIFDVTGIFAGAGEAGIINTIKDGGRVMAVKLDGSCSSKVDDIVNSAVYKQVYVTPYRDIAEESRFVKDIVGATDGELVVIKAGKVEECEDFFEEMHRKINS